MHQKCCCTKNNNSLFTNVLRLFYYKTLTVVAHFKTSTFIRTHKVSVFYSGKVHQSSFYKQRLYQNREINQKGKSSILLIIKLIFLMREGL